MIVINKIDVMKPEQLNPTEQGLLQNIISRDKVILAQLSCLTEVGVMDVRNQACDMLLASRVEMKMKGHKVNDILNKLHLAEPYQRDDKVGFHRRWRFMLETAVQSNRLRQYIGTTCFYTCNCCRESQV